MRKKLAAVFLVLLIAAGVIIGINADALCRKYKLTKGNKRLQSPIRSCLKGGKSDISHFNADFCF